MRHHDQGPGAVASKLWHLQEMQRSPARCVGAITILYVTSPHQCLEECSRSAVSGVLVDRGHDPARALDGLPVRTLLALQALEQAVEDRADFGHVPLEGPRGRLFTETLFEDDAKVAWDRKKVAKNLSQHCMTRQGMPDLLTSCRYGAPRMR